MAAAQDKNPRLSAKITGILTSEPPKAALIILWIYSKTEGDVDEHGDHDMVTSRLFAFKNVGPSWTFSRFGPVSPAFQLLLLVRLLAREAKGSVP
ncbi:hypothetical protein PHLCEN_2v13169 [Hermanssonia centrifuga]|uniref:Uncharacterized protein n=1 Tax=Hermanssonia centrifuga TaxID=98765 RepID=A0A2R6NEY4_9APHY|nr:hypothetical protein PHLCEN_2v13169 [Hermanssonia centrifuga]